VIEDGINGPGISYEKACEIVSEYDDAPRPPVEVLKEVYGLYGCNMAYRTSVIGNKRFDERKSGRMAGSCEPQHSLAFTVVLSRLALQAYALDTRRSPIPFI